MTAWLLVALAITAALIALAVAILARPAAAAAFLSIGFSCAAVAAALWRGLPEAFALLAIAAVLAPCGDRIRGMRRRGPAPVDPPEGT